MENTLMAEVMSNINYLPYHLQKQVLNYIKKLKKEHEADKTKNNLLRFAGSISEEDLAIMSEVIEKECGRVDLNEW